ncbi:hypothetical protein SPRG_01817 [Saprolegnia parasitica CBS 223.65]|uniref:Nudix hydrolase domain-containing protein n=1 Tax=Saprolegnia parasitica (strain CBS 223.65) TaxID=695850 RepID=A0A067CTU1_SAPPC|nr:hypothetical protein SPRG_01817 [Saprolegnia parasitica CBS 223.65]KDO33938.1 hypothetical protein SPRG_01817 [Saprolegnia parasitica CBS 223.65]|eukprot:XP_012195572.1 hypothetical protein SPRG_01817 [Saprolegnia parasitica CBS 223.65]
MSSILVRCLNGGYPQGAPPLDSLDEACISACNRHGLRVHVCEGHEAPTVLLQAMTTSQASVHLVVLRVASAYSMPSLLSMLSTLRRMSRQLFLCVFSARVSDDARLRYECFTHGASMVTSAIEDATNIIAKIAREDSSSSRHRGPYTCPLCGKGGMTEDTLWTHVPLFHINDKNKSEVPCPICATSSSTKQHRSTPFQVHMHNAHGPPGRGELPSEFRAPESSLYCFALVVVRHPLTKQFLLVQEFACSGYWLPGGRVDAGETPDEAALRETKEEAGLDIRLTGLLRLEYHPKTDSDGRSYVRMRFVFLGEPVDVNQRPKSIPDYESAGATWCHVDEIKSLPLRGPEPVKYFEYVAGDGPVHPMSSMYMKR